MMREAIEEIAQFRQSLSVPFAARSPAAAAALASLQPLTAKRPRAKTIIH